MEDLTLYLALAAGILEIIGRAIPNEKIKGPIGYVIEAINFVSIFFNRKTPY